MALIDKLLLKAQNISHELGVSYSCFLAVVYLYSGIVLLGRLQDGRLHPACLIPRSTLRTLVHTLMLACSCYTFRAPCTRHDSVHLLQDGGGAHLMT